MRLALLAGVLVANPATGLAATTIYLNGDGGAYTGSTTENAAANSSSVLLLNGVDSTTVSEFPGDEALWDSIRQCVALRLSSYDVVVTDVDPGSSPHLEIVIGGTGSEVGASWGVLAMAPFECGTVTADAIGFVPSDGQGGDPAAWCHAALQAIGSIAGLEWKVQCGDVMAGVDGDCAMPALFRDEWGACGVTSEASCGCARDGDVAGYNSHQEMVKAFGAFGEPPPDDMEDPPPDDTEDPPPDDLEEPDPDDDSDPFTDPDDDTSGDDEIHAVQGGCAAAPGSRGLAGSVTGLALFAALVVLRFRRKS